MKCDFCEEESDTASFNPEWDAVTCDECDAELENEEHKVLDDLRKMHKETDVDER